MKKTKLFLIILFCSVLFISSFIYGYNIIGKRVTKKPLKSEGKVDKLNNDLEIVKDDEKISPNTFIEKKIYYKECQHILDKTDLANEELVNMTEEEYRKYMRDNYPNIKIVSFSSQRILLREERNHLCPNHYVIGESEGKIAIYRIDESGERKLDKIFDDYSIKLLKEIDQKKLKDGIVVDSEEELSDVLENFIS